MVTSCMYRRHSASRITPRVNDASCTIITDTFIAKCPPLTATLRIRLPLLGAKGSGIAHGHFVIFTRLNSLAVLHMVNRLQHLTPPDHHQLAQVGHNRQLAQVGHNLSPVITQVGHNHQLAQVGHNHQLNTSWSQSLASYSTSWSQSPISTSWSQSPVSTSWSQSPVKHKLVTISRQL